MLWGSDTGAKEGVADRIANFMSSDLIIESIEISRTSTENVSEFEWLILGLSTWHDGELQSDLGFRLLKEHIDDALED